MIVLNNIKGFSRLQCNAFNPKEKEVAVKLPFVSIGKIPLDYVEKSFDFSYDMTFGRSGAHRAHRTGGTHQRRNGEIFANTFQGKLCEYAIYLELKDSHDINEPDVSVHELGIWDSYDFMVDGYTVSIKSTKRYGQLLLLETKDWTERGEYIPNNNEKYDFTFMVRLFNDPETIMKHERLFFSDDCEYNNLWDLFNNVSWEYDIPGYISQDELVYLITNEYIINRGDILNRYTVMDADNYYCHLADMHRFRKE